MTLENIEQIAAIMREASEKVSAILGYQVKVKYEDSQDLHTVTMEEVLKAVCVSFRVSAAQLVGASRRKEYVLARKAFSHICYTKTLGTLLEIGEVLGDRHHSSIIHFNKLAEKLLTSNDAFIGRYWDARNLCEGKILPESVLSKDEKPDKPKKKYPPKRAKKEARSPEDKPGISFGFGSKFLSQDKTPGNGHAFSEAGLTTDYIPVGPKFTGNR